MPGIAPSEVSYEKLSYSVRSNAQHNPAHRHWFINYPARHIKYFVKDLLNYIASGISYYARSHRPWRNSSAKEIRDIEYPPPFVHTVFQEEYR